MKTHLINYSFELKRDVYKGKYFFFHNECNEILSVESIFRKIYKNN